MANGLAAGGVCDEPTARLLAREVSDGIVAPGYDPKALEILKGKKQGKYGVVRIDTGWEPPATEVREVFGVALEQRRHDRPVTDKDFANVVSASKDLPPAARRDLTVAWLTLKYTQSNSVCFVVDGQAIGVGAGQQSRVHCVRLAGHKADLWRLRQHPQVLGLPFREGIGRAARDNAIDQFLRHDVTGREKAAWGSIFASVPRQLTHEEKRAWMDGLTGVACGSDAFFPFRDSIDRAAASGVKYV